QLEELEEIFFAGFFGVEIVCRIILGDERVGFGAPDGIVHAIEDADEAIGAGADDAFEAEAVFGGLNFLCVAAADGGEVIGENQAALEEIYFAVVFERVHGEEIIGQAD